MHSKTKTVLSICSVLPLLVAFILWIDARYLHKDISDIRYVDLQLIILEGHVKDVERQASLSEADRRYKRLQEQKIIELEKQRNILLGLNP